MGKVRKWKKPEASRGSSVVSTAQKAKPSWEKRLQQRAELKSLQAAQSAANDTIISEKRAARAAREAKALRKKENQEKGLSYQVISNTKKIKKMSKKQLKSISKMDTTGVKPKVFTKKEKKAAGMDTTQ